MQKIIMFRIAGLIFIFLFFISLINASQDDTEKLKTINAQIANMENKINNLRNEKKTILNEIYEIELQYEKERIESNKIDYQMNLLKKKISRKEDQKQKLETKINQSKENIKVMLRTLFKIPGNLYVILFLKARYSEQIFSNYGLFQSIVKFQSVQIQQVRQDMVKLDLVKRELEEQYYQLQTMNGVVEKKLRNIAFLKKNKLDYILKINNDRKKSMDMIEELKKESERLNDMIGKQKRPKNLPDINIKTFKGHMIWPINGNIISTFGRVRSTQFDTYIMNNGIEITPTESESIKAIFNGEIVFADYFKGYGNLIIIQHSQDFLSMYGHCDKFLKGIGEWVKTGEEIAVVGSSGSTVGKSLYFEIRMDLKAVNPLHWLKKR